MVNHTEVLHLMTSISYKERLVLSASGKEGTNTEGQQV